MEKHRRHERSVLDPFPDNREIIRIAVNTLRLGCDLRRLFEHVGFLAAGRQRSHPNVFSARVADSGLFEARLYGLGHRLHHFLRNDDPADRRAFLARFRRYLALRFLHEQIEFRRARGGIRPQDRCVQAVLLGDETN